MRRIHAFLRAMPFFVVLAAVSVLPNCGRTIERKALQFEPLPVAEVGARELEPAQSRTVSDLLRAANASFAEANTAQEAGDFESALRHYTAMLELLIEADLDPMVFYGLRPEFARILDASSRQAKAFDRAPFVPFDEEALRLMATSGLQYPYPLPERVLIEVEQIEQLYPENYARGLARSSKYLPYIREAFREAGLPEDLVWLAMVESQFTTKAVSRAGAGGMWQFMRSTGRNYGLRIDFWVDERFDWKRSTQAAIAYLTDLYAMFEQNWPLAISAYNMGERGMARAIAMNGGERDLWRLIETPPAANRIRRETKKFYPKLLASAIVAKSPRRYGMHPATEPAIETEYATVRGENLLKDIENEAGLPSGTLTALNPQLIRGATPPDHEYDIVVPAGMRVKVAAASRKVPKYRGATHTVQRGDTPGEIAQRYRVSAVELMRVNKIASPRNLRIGQKLIIPGSTGENGAATPVEPRPGDTAYTVRRNDSLSKIATLYGMTVSKLQRLNNMGKRTRIIAGDTLIVSDSKPAPPKPVKTPKPATPEGGVIMHTVKGGEFPAKIARRYEVKLDDFLAWNGLDRKSMIQVGDALKVYRPGKAPQKEPATAKNTATKVPAAPPKDTVKHTHRVVAGENASIIAAAYGVRTRDFLEWNQLSRRSVLHIGDESIVYLSEERAAEVRAVAMAQSEAVENQSEKTGHIVRNGENPSTIAKKYRVKLRDLFAWNGWEKNPVLHIGDVIVVYKK